MTTIDTSAALSPPRNWTVRLGWGLSGLFILFMIFDGGIKLVPIDPVIQTMTELGYPVQYARLLGVLSLVATLLYAIPRTSVLGAVLLTAYLGGAVSTHLRIGSPLFSHTLFGVYMGLFAWGGLWLRNPRLRAIFPVLR
ncbi:DoxX family protein [uncultured Devosia sp.]|uniref:DoxX family protein n=1 Tax=uncultured Devosia sp. TaxID=211434 RepID=UPI0035C96C79